MVLVELEMLVSIQLNGVIELKHYLAIHLVVSLMVQLHDSLRSLDLHHLLMQLKLVLDIQHNNFLSGCSLKILLIVALPKLVVNLVVV